MRPERLEVDGFGVFRVPTVIDFGGAELFALSGPTGSGKSTVIDAIVFALYGVVPRYNDKKLVGVAISQGKVEAKVRLTFTVGDERYLVVRVVRFVGKSAATASTKEARLERLLGAAPIALADHSDADADADADAGAVDSEVLAGTADEVTAAVERLLGLTYEHFTTCVVLPQGDFQRFLHAKPSDRQHLLVELLDLGIYASMGQLARGRAIAAKDNRVWVDKQLDEVAAYTPLVRAEIEADIRTFEALREQIDEVQPLIDKLTKQADAARAEAAAARTAVDALAAVVAPTDIASLARAIADASTAIEQARVQEDEAADAVAVAQQRQLDLSDRRALDRARMLHVERAKEQRLIERGEQAVEVAQAERDAAHVQTEAAIEQATRAIDALEAARRSNRAHEFVTALVAGEPCPVCLHPVGELPDHELADIDELVAIECANVAARDDGVARLAAADAELVRVADKLDDLRRRLAEHDEQLADHPDLQVVEAQLAAIDEAAAIVEQLVAREKSAKAARLAAEKARADLEQRSRAAWQAFDDLRDQLAGFGPPKADRVDLHTDWQALVAWADAERPGREADGSRAAQAVAEAEAEAAQALDGLRAAAVAAGLAADGPALRDAVIERLADERANLDSVDAALARSAQLRTDQAQLCEDEQVATALGNHLKSTAFEKWVLDDVVQRLVAGATQILLELSAGAYSLTFDSKGFAVADHNNADMVRSARSLSGGETFLASLALALALADEVAQLAATGTVRLESIFLDEGFGTLDPDTLDTVATAIEELGASGRMVGLVTHVHDLAERLPTRFEVVKAGNTSIVTRVES